MKMYLPFSLSLMTNLVCAKVGPGFENRESLRMWFLPLLWPLKVDTKRKWTMLLSWVQYLSQPSLKVQFAFTSEREKTKPAPTFFTYFANQISCLAAMIPLTTPPYPSVCSLCPYLVPNPQTTVLKLNKTTENAPPIPKTIVLLKPRWGEWKMPKHSHTSQNKSKKSITAGACDSWTGPCLADPTIKCPLCVDSDI